MAKGIKDMMGEEVEVYVANLTGERRMQRGTLVSEDAHGILLSVANPARPFRTFVPWASIDSIRAEGGYEPPRTNSSRTRQGTRRS